MRRRCGGALCVLAFTALAQQISAPVSSPQPVFRTSTKLVQVSVIAQDKDGKPVAGLQREDFQLFDNGKPQPIQLFIAERPSPPESLPPNAFTNKLARSTGYSVLLFDSNSTLWEHAAKARLRALKAFQEIPPDDKIAIYSLWCKFRVVREFSSDRESLLQFLNTFSPAAGACANGSTGDGTEGTLLQHDDDAPDRLNQASEQRREAARQAAEAQGRVAAEFNRIASLLNFSMSDDEIRNLADHLPEFPGARI